MLLLLLGSVSANAQEKNVFLASLPNTKEGKLIQPFYTSQVEKENNAAISFQLVKYEQDKDSSIL